MAGNTNFPTSLDDDTSLHDVEDGTSTLLASHHNNLKEAVKALEAKLGIYNTSAPTALDYRLGNPTGGHRHDGASGMGPKINPTTIPLPSGAYPVNGLTLHDRLMAHPETVTSVEFLGAYGVGTNLLPPLMFPKTYQILDIALVAARGPSGGTWASDIIIGATSAYYASPGLRPILPPLATIYHHASPNVRTIPSGVVVKFNIDSVGADFDGTDLRMTFLLRE